MSNKEDKSIGKEISYRDLWLKEYFKVIIPKIQRDFAYGRENNLSNRTRFLNAIYDSIDPAATEKIQMDFVFGQKTPDRSFNDFYPLDGQQRLTILYLINLYVGKRSRKNAKELDYLVNFSYETRDSSTEFTKKLIAIEPEYFDGAKGYDGVTRYIRDQWWYNNDMALDPTITSMIKILEDVHKKYGNYTREQMEKVWENLHDNVTFWLITLEDLQTTDDLYIKMNSRGKPLTSFEHFKALLDEYYGNAGELSMKIDTVWTHLLWYYRKYAGNPLEFHLKEDYYTDNELDKRFMNLFYRFMIMEGAKAGIIEYPTDDNYGKKDILTLADEVLGVESTVLDRIARILDFFANLPSVSDFFNSLVTQVYEEKRLAEGMEDDTTYKVYINEHQTNDFLELATGDRLSLPNTAILEAFFEFAYLKRSARLQSENESQNIEKIVSTPLFTEQELEEFKDRLRIIRNLENNLYLHNYEMRDILKRVDLIVASGQLKGGEINDAFTDPQKDQEILKLQWSATHTPAEWLTLRHVENSRLLYGNLYPLMSDRHSLDLTSLKGFQKIFTKDADFDLIKKSLLTRGDYATIEGKLKKYGSGEKSKWATWRDQIFINKNEAFAPAFNELLSLLQYQIETANSSYPQIENQLAKICSDYIGQCHRKREYPWTYYLVNYSIIRQGVYKKGDLGYYKIVEPPYDYLMAVGVKGRSWNPYLRALQELLPSSTLGDDGDWLEYGNLQIWIGNREVTLYYPDETMRAFEIQVDATTGTDRVDRIYFTRDVVMGYRFPVKKMHKHNDKRDRRYRYHKKRRSLK